MECVCVCVYVFQFHQVTFESKELRLDSFRTGSSGQFHLSIYLIKNQEVVSTAVSSLHPPLKQLETKEVTPPRPSCVESLENFSPGQNVGCWAKKQSLNQRWAASLGQSTAKCPSTTGRRPTVEFHFDFHIFSRGSQHGSQHASQHGAIWHVSHRSQETEEEKSKRIHRMVTSIAANVAKRTATSHLLVHFSLFFYMFFGA